MTPYDGDADWVFASPFREGKLPYEPHGVQKHRIAPAAQRAGLPKGIGWHTLRHSYSTMLRHLKVDLKVQQDLLRHADVKTTMNVCTHEVPEDLRTGNRKLVRMVLQGGKVALSRSKRGRHRKMA